jgi:hypothetical protein
MVTLRADPPSGGCYYLCMPPCIVSSLVKCPKESWSLELGRSLEKCQACLSETIAPPFPIVEARRRPNGNPGSFKAPTPDIRFALSVQLSPACQGCVRASRLSLAGEVGCEWPWLTAFNSPMPAHWFPYPYTTHTTHTITHPPSNPYLGPQLFHTRSQSLSA